MWTSKIIVFGINRATFPLRFLLSLGNKKLSYQPLTLIIFSVLATHTVHKTLKRIPKDGILAGFKRKFFSLCRKLPVIKNKIDIEFEKADQTLEKDVAQLYTTLNAELACITQLPQAGMSNENIIEKIKEYMDLGPYNWKDGKCSGAVYHGGNLLTELFVKVYELTVWANPLHMNVFPGVCKMEAEVVRISANLFHGDENTCGTVTSGGTESLLLAVKVYRDWARDAKGILNPEILVPTTAHAAFDKACQFLDIRIVKVPINSKTCTVDLKKMRRLITKNTCMLVGSAPGYPHGCMDDIQGIAELGQRYDVPVHVDACLGGFLICFLEKAGYRLSPFDFRLEGVTSISADTHKYGNSPKGSSVLLFKNLEFKHYQYFVETNWPGGIYASPSLAGSRAGALVAGCWATLLSFGTDGYVDSTRKIIETTKYILEGTKNIPGVFVMGNPEVSIVAWASKDFDIYRLLAAMTEKGWQVNALQFPPSIHFCVAHCQTQEGIKEKFVMDFKSSVNSIMASPEEPTADTAAIYGTTQRIPDRSLVKEIAFKYLDKLYQTEFKV